MNNSTLSFGFLLALTPFETVIHLGIDIIFYSVYLDYPFYTFYVKNRFNFNITVVLIFTTS